VTAEKEWIKDVSADFTINWMRVIPEDETV
jgi:hypothetical protein